MFLHYLLAYKYKGQGELYSVYHKAITDVNCVDTTILPFALKTSLHESGVKILKVYEFK